jgi:hypothetical protein
MIEKCSWSNIWRSKELTEIKTISILKIYMSKNAMNYKAETIYIYRERKSKM